MATSHSNSTGLTIPNIALGQIIGSGGFSVVHRGFDTKLNRDVAVKVLTSTVEQGDIERFERECQVHGPLSSHPNIITVYDAAIAPSGSPYLVMELVEGGSLANQIANTAPVDLATAVNWMIPVCHAVQAAHDHGVLHRDIKPSNILLSPEGPKLADFGIACGSNATSPEFAVSWKHAPPEAFENQRDERSDVYSLASTLFALVTGASPFESDGQSNAGLLAAIQAQAPPHLPSGVGSPQLDRILQSAMAKDPNARPQTATALANELIGVKQAPLVPTPTSEAPTEIVAAPSPATVAYGAPSAAYAMPPQGSPQRGLGRKLGIAVAAVGIIGAGLAFIDPAGAWLKESFGTDGTENVAPSHTASESTVTTPTTRTAMTAVAPSDKPTTTTTAVEPSSSTMQSTTSTTPAISTVPIAELVVVPELIGSTTEFAKTALLEAGLEVSVKRRRVEDGQPLGVVLEQTPGWSATVEKGSTVEIVVSVKEFVIVTPLAEVDPPVVATNYSLIPLGENP